MLNLAMTRMTRLKCASSIAAALSGPRSVPMALALLVSLLPSLFAQLTNSPVSIVAPEFSVSAGFFETSFSLSITSATPGAVIYYSLDSSEPGPDKGSRYTGPFPISSTSVLRARAFKQGMTTSVVKTGTYLFLADVIHQAPGGQPPPHFPSSWGRNAVDYGMDPAVIGRYSPADWREALTQIPSISVVTEMKNLFDSATGIYANALGQGEAWERPASIELLDPSMTPQSRFQENCGLRIRGGYSRNPQYPKHSFRIFFRRDYGASKLKYPLFERDGAGEFDTFDLRTSQNYAWAIDGKAGQHDTMVREVFCRETLGALGQPSTRSRYYHLYLNGQYWGLYETQERPEAAYGSTYFGGQKEDYDVVKSANHSGSFVTEVTDGNFDAYRTLWTKARSVATNSANENYFAILGCDPNGARNPTLPVWLDVDNLIDYMLVIFYSGDGDATLSSFLSNERPNNWFGLRHRTNSNTGFRFFNHDAEHTLGAPFSQVDRTGPFLSSNQNDFAYANPQWIHQDLMANAEYRLRFADHVQRHFFNGGALTSSAGTNRFLRKAAQIDKAIRAYAARWGDAQRDPPYGEIDWREMINNIVNNWFPSRTAIVLQQLRQDGLYPSLSAPGIKFQTNSPLIARDEPYPGSSLRREGALKSFGVDPSLFTSAPANVSAVGSPGENYSLALAHANASGTIYFTMDGSDPRLVGGALAPGARSYAAPVPISATIRVLARVRDGTNWSALADAGLFRPEDFTTLHVTELMYNPPKLLGLDGENFEFIELKNTGTHRLDLSGLSFAAGIEFTFTNGTQLAPGDFFVLAQSATNFAVKYPGVAFQGVFTGKLDNGGEIVTLDHLSGATVFSFRYEDDPPWPSSADGAGYSLVPSVSNGPSNSSDAFDWRLSARPGGSPGADDPSSETDTDRDRLPDSWERANGFNPSDPGDPNLDADSDGYTNLEEYRAGTNPRDPSSILRLSIRDLGRTLGLGFLAISNLSYTVQSASDLKMNSWQTFTNIPSAPTNRLLTIPDLPGAQNRFYRLRIFR